MASVRLHPMMLEHLDAEDVSGDALAALLGVAAPPVWPPEHNDAGTRDWMRQTYMAEGWDSHWAGRYIIAGGDLVGVCGYFGQPQDGAVEIGYAIIAPSQRKGHASEAVRQLCAHAFANEAVTTVRATTLADGAASQGVLTKCGFHKTGEAVDPGEGPVWQFALDRPA